MDLEELIERKGRLQKELRDVDAAIAVAENKTRLWAVQISGLMLVYASDLERAKAVALYNASEFSNMKTSVKEITKRSEVPKGWLTAVPWEGVGSYDDRLYNLTTADFLAGEP